jgi:hypothetical protein
MTGGTFLSRSIEEWGRSPLRGLPGVVEVRLLSTGYPYRGFKHQPPSGGPGGPRQLRTISFLELCRKNCG